MKRIIAKWAARITATGLLLLGILAGIALNPNWLYANKTAAGMFTVYHHSPLEKDLITRLDDAAQLLKSSELFNENTRLNLCLNDGSIYPKLMETLRGQAFGWGFSDIIVLMGDADSKANYVALNGHQWNLTQLIAHEAVHCLQFEKYGFLHSNPVAGHPNWKWEGYPEYIARKDADQLYLKANIERKMDETDGWAFHFKDGTVAPRDYYEAWLLMQYCLDIKQMSFDDLLKDTTSQQALTQQMMDYWYSKQESPPTKLIF
ncbi:MAG: hypothetical protein IPN76_29360 [Saprospiraceae bacterium]|nr:hypothetical protein [Saprospiraceae bacterium]